MFLAEDDVIGLSPYTHDDDPDMYLCWQDIGTQKGYNFRFDIPFDAFIQHDISRFKFWMTVVDKKRNAKIGALRLGLDETCPDLAIWIYPPNRNMGYGKQAYWLALQYLFERYPYQEISAGCFTDNKPSRKMLKRLGFTRHPAGDAEEENPFTGEKTTQLAFRISRDRVL